MRAQAARPSLLVSEALGPRSGNLLASVLLATVIWVPWLVAPGGVAAQDASSAVVEDQEDVVAEMVSIARALEESVQGRTMTDALYGFSQAERLLLAGDDPARLEWSYWPRPRAGLQLEFMTAEQKRLLHDLLTATLSVKGYLKVTHIMQLEDVLRALETTPLPRDVGVYSLVFFGPPSVEEPWAWRFEGHHVSLSVTVRPGQSLTVTPSFLGSNPAEIRTGPMAGFRVLPLEEDLGFQLVSSMGPDQRRRAVLGDDPPGDILSTTLGRDADSFEEWKEIVQPDGLPVGEMRSDQRALVRRILDEVVTTYRPEISRDYLARIVVDDLHFAWIGRVEEDAPHYYRIQGPDFVFEYDDTQGDANHIHSVWRSRAADFGGDVLERHYREAH